MSLTKRPDKHHSYDDVSPKLSIQKSFLLLLYAHLSQYSCFYNIAYFKNSELYITSVR